MNRRQRQLAPEQIQAVEFSPQRLREARERQFGPRSRARFARLIGASPQQLYAYEAGRDRPNPTVLARICLGLGVDILSLTERSP